MYFLCLPCYASFDLSLGHIQVFSYGKLRKAAWWGTENKEQENKPYDVADMLCSIISCIFYKPACGDTYCNDAFCNSLFADSRKIPYAAKKIKIHGYNILL